MVIVSDSEKDSILSFTRIIIVAILINHYVIIRNRQTNQLENK